MSDALHDTTQPSEPSVVNAEPLSLSQAEAVLANLASLFLNGAVPSFNSPAPAGGLRAAEKKEATPGQENMYRVLVEQIPAVIFVGYLDRGVSEAYVSPQIEAVLGFSQEEWLEDPIRWYRQVHPDDKDRWSLDAAEMFLSGKPLKSTYRVVAKDGRVVWFQCEAKMVRREDGRPWFIHGVGFDISDLKRTEESLQKRTVELRELSARLFRAQDEERRRIARELHDSLGQYLAGLKMNLAVLKKRGDSSMEQLLSESEKILERCIVETRTLSHLLHPPLLDEMGLIAATRWYVDGFAKRSGIEVTMDINPGLGRLSQAFETALFRVVQESLTNIYRHSGSKTAEVRLTRDNAKVTLQVRDCGRGMPPKIVNTFRQKGAGGGIGLSGMRERISELDGRFEISSDSNGTIVSATIPL